MNARRLIVSALTEANVRPVAGDASMQSFLNGAGDIKFKDVEMDSLARMEFCISIEVHSGVSIAPDALGEIESLARLAEMIEART